MESIHTLQEMRKACARLLSDHPPPRYVDKGLEPYMRTPTLTPLLLLPQIAIERATPPVAPSGPPPGATLFLPQEWGWQGPGRNSLCPERRATRGQPICRNENANEMVQSLYIRILDSGFWLLNPER